jgi:hypothetical protein
MTDGTRILRTLALPLLVGIVLLFAVPKMCGGLMQKGLALRKPKSALTVTGTGDLAIQSSTPDPEAKRTLTYPDGLDESRVRYLVETDARFTNPKRVTVPRSAMDADKDPLTASLIQSGNFAAQPDGSLAPTRDAALHIDGLREEAGGWTMPVAQRKFVEVRNIADQGGGTYRVTVRWKWEPNAVGRGLPDLDGTHDSDVDLAGGAGSWSAANFSGLL